MVAKECSFRQFCKVEDAMLARGCPVKWRVSC